MTDKEVIQQLCRLLLPLQMTWAESELANTPLGEELVVLSYSGCGASDQVTWGMVKKALSDAQTYLDEHYTPDQAFFGGP